MRPLLIGVGNDFAGDDAAGRLVVRALEGADAFDTAETHGAAADIVTLMEGRAHVVIVDACTSGAMPGTVHKLDAVAGDLPGWLRSVSSHGIGVAEAVALARMLGSLPERVEVWAIEGTHFCVGDGVSDPVKRAVADVIAALPAAVSN